MKHKKTKKTKAAKTNREYKIAFKSRDCYCYICNRRAGIFNAYCGPFKYKPEIKPRNWKHYRRTQYKTRYKIMFIL